MKKTLLLSILTLLFGISANAQSIIDQFISAFNAECPLVIDETLTLKNVDLQDREVVFVFDTAGPEWNMVADNADLFKSTMIMQFNEMAKEEGMKTFFQLLLINSYDLKCTFISRENNKSCSVTLTDSDLRRIVS